MAARDNKIIFFRLVLAAAVISMAALFFSFMTVLTLIESEARKEASHGHDAILVLGAGLNGDKVSNILAKRLDTAIEYANENPDAILIMSGGQGDDELVSEAYAMKEYAVAKGIDEDRILMEEKSTSTGENFTYSKKILDDYFEAEYSIVVVTNDFHIFRSGIVADKLGMAYESLAADSPGNAKNYYIFREYFAVMKYYFVSI